MPTARGVAVDDHVTADSGDDVGRLVALTERQHELWSLLRDSDDEASRNQLFDELTANREELAKLKETVSARLDEPMAPSSSREPAAEPSAQPSLRDRIKEAEAAVQHVIEESPATTQSRSVGEELRSKIFTPPDAVTSEPPAPERLTFPDSALSPPPTPPAAPGSQSPPPVESPPTRGKDSGLAPEDVPYSTREADLAATRRRRGEDSAPYRQAGVAADTPAEPTPQSPPAPEPRRDAAQESQPRTAPREDPERPRPAQVAYRDLQRVRPKHVRPFPFVAIFVALAAVAAVAWLLFLRPSDSVEPGGVVTQTTVGTSVAPGAATDSNAVGQIRAVLDGLGLSAISIEERGGTIYLTGSVATEDDRAAALGASQALAGSAPVDASGLTTTMTDDEVRATALQAIATAGYDRVNVSISAGVATLSGVTPEEGSAGLISAVSGVDGINQVVDLTETSDRSVALDTELKRITAVTPIVFASGQTDLNALQQRILDSVAEIIQAYGGPEITIVGYTDATGSDADNERISLIRAENVRDYLVAQGIPADRFVLDARGEASSSGSQAVAGLERRVEFEVGYSVAVGSGSGDFRIGIVAPSARDDLAFTQSIVDATDVVAAERGGISIDITDGTFVPDDAAAAIRAYAADGYDLVIAHGSQYGTALAEIATEFPDTAFAWGTAADTFGLENVSSYEVASDEGGYTMGVVSALLSQSHIIGVVGPLEVGDAKLFVDGFRNGVLATDAGAQVPTTYTGSFSDVALAAEAATAQINAGADILTGTAQMVVGAVGVASENNALWFGTQSNQTELAPDLVVASQVYHWEVVLRQIISGIEQGTLGGEAYTINLANGGIIIEYNPGFDLPAEVRTTADDTIAGIIAGTISTGI